MFFKKKNKSFEQCVLKMLSSKDIIVFFTILLISSAIWIPVESVPTSKEPFIENRNVIREKQYKLMQSFMNASVDPCDNFYDYACGNWERHNPIPNDKWRYSTTQILQQNLLHNLKDLLSEPIDGDGPLSAMNKAKLYYKNCMDKEAQVKLGVEPLLKFIKDLGGWPVLDENWSEKEFDWLQLAIDTSFVAKGIIMAFEVIKNPSVPMNYTLFLRQPTLGMNNRDNYLKEENSKNLAAYRIFVKKVLLLLNVGQQKAHNVSEEIVNFEVELANATLPLEASKTERYHQLNISDLNTYFDFIDWKKYLSGVHGTEVNMNETVVMQLGLEYYDNLYDLLDKTENVTLANYMIWRCVHFVIINLGDGFRATFDEFTSALTGQVEPDPLWKICVIQVNSGMGMATSGLFIRKYFDESSKNETIKIIDSLKEAFNENLEELEWIDDSTKTYASKKVNAMKVAAGYPDYIRSKEALNKLYNDIEILNGNHFDNYFSITKRNWRKSRDRLFKPYDKNQWAMPPTIVNALYDFGGNLILVLASLLQPPIFHNHFTQSLNYGAIGTFLGHEVIHGFDDKGRKFDSAGDLLNWWSPKSVLQFEERKKCFLKQYENFSKLDGSFKAIATLSENLADNGGLRLAYNAYSKLKPLNISSVNEVTFSDMKLKEDQIFFLSFAQAYCAAVRPEALIESYSYDVHSPERYRVLGALMNFEKFSEVFKCPTGSRLNPSNRCRIW